jgi:hypothetical protein
VTLESVESVEILQANLRAAIADHDAAKAKLSDLVARQTSTEVARDEATQAAEVAERAYEFELGADDPSAAPAAKAESERCAAASRELSLTCKRLAERVKQERSALESLVRSVAHKRQLVAVVFAAQRKARVRASALAFAKDLRRWHEACEAASRAHYEATGNVGEIVPHTGHNAALLIHGSDDGLPGIFRREGIAANLQPTNSIRATSERELLGLHGHEPIEQTAAMQTGDIQ